MRPVHGLFRAAAACIMPCILRRHGAALMSIWHAVFWFVVLVAFALLGNSWLRLRRAEFIRTYR